MRRKVSGGGRSWTWSLNVFAKHTEKILHTEQVRGKGEIGGGKIAGGSWGKKEKIFSKKRLDTRAGGKDKNGSGREGGEKIWISVMAGRKGKKRGEGDIIPMKDKGGPGPKTINDPW